MPTSIQLIKGIGPAAAKQLARLGFNSAEDLALASIEDLMEIQGFGEARARQVIQDASNLTHAQRQASAPIAATAGARGEASAPPEFDDDDVADDEEDFGDEDEIDEFEDEIEDEFFDGPSAPAPAELKEARQEDAKKVSKKKDKKKKDKKKDKKKGKKQTAETTGGKGKKGDKKKGKGKKDKNSKGKRRKKSGGTR